MRNSLHKIHCDQYIYGLLQTQKLHVKELNFIFYFVHKIHQTMHKNEFGIHFDMDGLVVLWKSPQKLNNRILHISHTLCMYVCMYFKDFFFFNYCCSIANNRNDLHSIDC